MKFELIIDSNIELAETPIWDHRNGKLYWNDLFTGDVFEFDPVTKQSRMWKTNKLIGSSIPCEDESKLFVMLEDGAYLLDKESGELTLIADPEPGNDKNRYNDTRIDAAGRIFASSVAKTYGTDAYTPDQLGAFYMIDTDKSIKTIVEGINQYNCMVWNRDNTKMIVVDTYNQTLLCFDYDIAKGPVSEPKIVIDFKDKQGMPDGVSIDEDDNLYICHWSGKISVWDKDFKFVEDIAFPVEFVCCGGFGGENMSDFYVASSKYCYNEAELAKNPGAGGTFVAHTSIKGRGDHFYK